MTAATEKQISYILSLVSKVPANSATACLFQGANLSALTSRQASQFIEALKSGLTMMDLMEVEGHVNLGEFAHAFPNWKKVMFLWKFYVKNFKGHQEWWHFDTVFSTVDETYLELVAKREAAKAAQAAQVETPASTPATDELGIRPTSATDVAIDLETYIASLPETAQANESLASVITSIRLGNILEQGEVTNSTLVFLHAWMETTDSDVTMDEYRRINAAFKREWGYDLETYIVDLAREYFTEDWKLDPDLRGKTSAAFAEWRDFYEFRFS